MSNYLPMNVVLLDKDTICSSNSLDLLLLFQSFHFLSQLDFMFLLLFFQFSYFSFNINFLLQSSCCCLVGVLKTFLLFSKILLPSTLFSYYRQIHNTHHYPYCNFIQTALLQAISLRAYTLFIVERVSFSRPPKESFCSSH